MPRTAAVTGNALGVAAVACFCLRLVLHPSVMLLQVGWTPLHKAAEYGQKEVVSQLLDAGAVVGAADMVRPRPLLCRWQ
jgi:ankyrin repeat protein